MKKTFYCVAMRGRYIDNPNLRIAGLPTKQRLEISGEKGDVTNAITTIQKDNLVLIKYEDI